MKKISQSHTFDVQKEDAGLVKVVVASALIATGAFAAEPLWYTGLVTQLADITGYVLVILGAVVTIRLVPLAWNHIKSVINR